MGEMKVWVTPTVSVSPMNLPGGSRSREKRNVNKMGEKKVWVTPTVSVSPKPSVKGVASTSARNYKNLKGASHLKNQNNIRKAKPKQLSNENVPEKTLYIIELKTQNGTVKPTQNSTIHTIQPSPSSEEKSLRRARNGNYTTRSPPSLSPSSENKSLGFARNGIHTIQSPLSSENENLRLTRNGIHTTRLSPSSEKKILRDTPNGSYTTQLSSSSLASLSSSISLSKSTDSEENVTISEHDETETENQVANPKVEYNRPRKGGIISLEDKDGLPRKLSFRRGKVVDLLSENNGPRRLRFKQGRGLGENQKGKADSRRRSFRRREVVDDELNGTKTESEKVVLKHQDVEGKKDAQSLFNNVIEETASKLAETRKSKVKALVGAFETVISLQDTKSLAKTSTC